MANITKHRGRATRYARALFDVAVAEGDPRAIESDLSSFAGFFEEFPPLRRALWSPFVAPARKKQVVDAIVAKGHYPAPLVKLLNLLIERDLLPLLPEVLAAYRRRVMDHDGIVAAHVTTAVPLGEETLREVSDALGKLTGKQVQMTTAVDPALIGGVVARLDSTVYDGSVARQLELLKEKMAGGA